jgi:hypothetical protein
MTLRPHVEGPYFEAVHAVSGQAAYEITIRGGGPSSRHVGDFTRWKEHDSYQKAFERLLRDLKAGA